MKTPQIIADWLAWYRASPRWFFWAPIVGVLFLWALLVLA